MFVRSFIRSFVHSFVCLFICSFVRSFIRLFVSPFVCPPLPSPTVTNILSRATGIADHILPLGRVSGEGGICNKVIRHKKGAYFLN